MRLGRRGRIALKVGVWAACLLPAALLAQRALADDLGANPISFITLWLGDWTLRILLASLAMTPLRLLFGWSWPITLRRLLGLFAFAYAALHFLVWVLLDHFFTWGQMAEDLVKRPYITVGMAALLLMVPLAVTSTAGMIRRLGGTTWRRLHRLVYATAVCAVLHYLWLAKKANPEPYYYAAALLALLGVRAADWARRALARGRAPAPAR
jgi:sulfoxide reductase heme-binding subunit YedZ